MAKSVGLVKRRNARKLGCDKAYGARFTSPALQMRCVGGSWSKVKLDSPGVGHL